MNVSKFKNMILDYTRKISENTNNAFSPICEQYGLTMLQVRILLQLHNYGSHTIGSLAEGISVAGANISAMCKKLENMGFLKRVRDQNDERVVKVALTEEGDGIIVKIDKDLNDKFLENLSDETEESFEDIILGLKKLNELLQRISSLEK